MLLPGFQETGNEVPIVRRIGVRQPFLQHTASAHHDLVRWCREELHQRVLESQPVNERHYVALSEVNHTGIFTLVHMDEALTIAR